MDRRQLLLGLLILTVLRWAIAAATELTPAESLVWLGSRQAPLGFFDHGPLASWFAWAGTMLAGSSALGVRLMAPLAIFGASWVGWRLAASAFGEKAARWFVTAMQVIPLVNVAAVRGLPETYAFFFAVVGAWWLWQALHRASPWAWQWIAAGFAFGCGVLAAPTGAGLLVGMIVLMVLPRRWRGRWRSPGPWLALTAALAAASPWIWWLRAQDWLPLTSAGTNWARPPAAAFSIFRWLGLLVLAASPLLGAGMGWAGGRAVAAAAVSWRRFRIGGLHADDPFDQKNGRVFLLALAAPNVLWAVADAIRGPGTMGVLAFPGVAALMLLAAAWVESPLLPATHRLAQNATLIIAGAYSLFALHSDLARHLGLPWGYRFDPAVRSLGWKEAAAQTASAARALAAGSAASRPVFLIADSPGLAASLGFYLPSDLPLPAPSVTRLRCHVPARLAVDTDFSFWPGYSDEPAWHDHDALFVSEQDDPAALGLLSHQFRQLESLGRIEIRRGGWPLRSITFFACRSWRGPAR